MSENDSVSRYELGVKRKIKSKRGSGTRDSDTVETVFKGMTLRELLDCEEDVFESHQEAMEKLRDMDENGEIEE